MTLKRTGAGKVGLYPTSDGRTHAILYNFDIDGAELKTEHQHFLETQVAPLLTQDGSTIVKGLCSRSGSWKHNNTLSEKRADKVHLFLSRAARRATGIFLLKGLSEDAAEDAGHKDGTENEFFRAVELIVSPARHPGILPPKKQKPKPYPPKQVNWRKVDIWLEVDTLDIGPVKKLHGTLGMHLGCGRAYAWYFSASLAGMSLSPKGKPPLWPGSIRTHGLPFSYNAEIFDPTVFWKKKTVHVNLYGSTVGITIENALPRKPGPDYTPIKLGNVKIQGKDISFKLRPDSAELGGSKGIGSIEKPKLKTVTGIVCA